ncbi:MAG: hypothetical protein P1R58_08615 [bacterium]|nr:hypothetical protein [bacterium]
MPRLKETIRESNMKEKTAILKRPAEVAALLKELDSALNKRGDQRSGERKADEAD